MGDLLCELFVLVCKSEKNYTRQWLINNNTMNFIGIDQSMLFFKLICFELYDERETYC